MNVTGLGELPHNLGPAHVTSDLATPVDAIVSVSNMQQLGFSVHFPSGGGVIVTDQQQRKIIEGTSPIISAANFIDHPTELCELVSTSIPVVSSVTLSVPRIFPIGVPKEWRRAGLNAADGERRQSLVNYAHRLTHSSINGTIRNAEAGAYDHLGISPEHIKASPPICSSCAVKKLVRRTSNKPSSPEQMHTNVGDVLSVDQFFMGKHWPKARGDIFSILTSIDACSSHVHVFPVYGSAASWTSSWVTTQYDRLINMYKLWNHKVRIFRSDNDTVLVSELVKKWAEKAIIGLQHSASGSHEQNGLVERFHGFLRTWIETVYDDMDHLPLNLWYYVILAGVQAWNITFHNERPFTPWH